MGVLPMKSVGIDIGSYSIKVVEAVSSNKGVQITQFSEHPLGQNPAHDPQIEIVEFIRGLASTYDPASTRFVLAFAKTESVFAIKAFPSVTDKKFLKACPLSWKKTYPFPMIRRSLTPKSFASKATPRKC